ncbi:MAG: tetratricopeptide repeat protein [Acidobacteriota bacterium]
MPLAAPRLARLALVSLAVSITACSSYVPFDSVSDLRAKFDTALGAKALEVEVPFELSADLLAWLDTHLSKTTDEKSRVEQVLNYIFDDLNLRYSLSPTYDAMGTYQSHRGNCLSFVNLFVGIARHQRLAPFYVEVTDYQRWSYRDGMVVSQGHIVAGLNLNGGMKTYDFLPYKAKSYRGFKPIDDLAAAAHYYNNLGAEALMAGEADKARNLLELANRLQPRFVKAINNLGVLLARRGELAAAEATYRRGLEVEPANVALLNNLAQVCQRQGRDQEAATILGKIANENNTNPFFFVYRAEQALSKGDTEQAMKMMVEALRRDSEAPEVQLGFVKVYMAIGDLEKARHHLERALRLDATNQEALRFAKMLQTAPEDKK